jgi:hypothetical protein
MEAICVKVWIKYRNEKRADLSAAIRKRNELRARGLPISTGYQNDCINIYLHSLQRINAQLRRLLEHGMI